MKSSTLASLASVALGATCWLWTIVAEPGTQMWAALGAGSAAWATVALIVAAVRADLRERLGRLARSEVDR